MSEISRPDPEYTEQNHVDRITVESTVDRTCPAINSRGDQPTVTKMKTVGDQGGQPKDTLNVHVQNNESSSYPPIDSLPDPVRGFNTDSMDILPKSAMSILPDPDEETRAGLGARPDIDKSLTSTLGPQVVPYAFNNPASESDRRPSHGGSLAAHNALLEESSRDPFLEDTPPWAPSGRIFNSPHEGPTSKISRFFPGVRTSTSPSALRPALKDEVRELSERLSNLERLIRESQEHRWRSVSDCIHCVVQEDRENRDKELVDSNQEQVPGHIKEIAEAYVQRTTAFADSIDAQAQRTAKLFLNKMSKGMSEF